MGINVDIELNMAINVDNHMAINVDNDMVIAIGDETAMIRQGLINDCTTAYRRVVKGALMM